MRTQFFSFYCLFFLILLYRVHVHCSLHITKAIFLMQEENVFLKFLAVKEQIAISGDIMVRIPQELDVVAF